MTPNKPDPTNGEEKMREEDILEATLAWHDELLDTDKACVMCGAIPDNVKQMAIRLAQLKSSNLALLEQIVRENEGRRKEEQTDDLSPAFVRQDVKDMCFNSALDLINTDLRAKIEELKKTI